MLIEEFLDGLATDAVQRATGEETPALLRPTADPRHGDYQLNAALPLAKRLKKNPREIAALIADEVGKHEAIAAAAVAGPGFVNLRLDAGWIAKELDAMTRDDRDGVPFAAQREKVVVDYSSPNIAKQMHVGHLRSTIIGAAVVEILRYIGHDVIADNHLGDWGTQFGLLIVGMREYGDETALDKEPIVELERIYKAASARAKEDEDFAASARAELAKLQNGDEENIRLWKHFVEATRVKLDEVYGRLGVHFNEWLGESAYNDRLQGIVDLLVEKGIARKNQGAQCVFFKELEGAPKALKKQKEPFLVQKSDGAFLYSTTDIATIEYRREKFGAKRIIYVVDMRQSQHFKMLFAVADLLGWGDTRYEHLGFGTVMGNDGKPLKTRDASGNVITLSALLDEAESRAAERLREEKVDIAEADIPEVARVVGIGAVKYADLHQNRASDYTFDFDKMISFKGNAGPYMQYAYARVQSIFRRGEVSPEAIAGSIKLEADAELGLARVLLRFGQVVHQAADAGHPHLITDHLYELARAYSGFYEACPVLKAEAETRDSRLLLCWLTARQMRRGLSLLGIETLDRM